MNIQNLDPEAKLLTFTPLELNHFGEWDTPRFFADTLSLSYLFPVSYQDGEIGLQEGQSLCVAISVTKSLQKYDGAGMVHSIFRVKNNGGKKVRTNPWEKPKGPKDGEAVAVPNAELELVLK